MKRLISIVCVQDAGKNKTDFRLIYYYDEDGKITHETRRVPLKKRVTDSIIKEHPVADLFEREIHDYYGVEFAGNPHLHTTLLLPEEEKHFPPMLKKGEHSHA
ncbi:MAG: NADH-quinone oxidoreductase subunit C [archaeon]